MNRRFSATSRRHDWSGADGLQARLLPLVCRYCSTPSSRGQERTTGDGCEHCGMLGVPGRRLIVGLWEMVDGKPTFRIFHGQQARDLVAQDRVACQDAEDLLGLALLVPDT